MSNNINTWNPYEERWSDNEEKMARIRAWHAPIKEGIPITGKILKLPSEEEEETIDSPVYQTLGYEIARSFIALADAQKELTPLEKGTFALEQWEYYYLSMEDARSHMSAHYRSIPEIDQDALAIAKDDISLMYARSPTNNSYQYFAEETPETRQEDGIAPMEKNIKKCLRNQRR